MSAAGGGELEDDGVEWPGQHDGLAAEPEPHVLLADVNMVEGQAADRGGPLGVKENEQDHPQEGHVRQPRSLRPQVAFVGPKGAPRRRPDFRPVWNNPEY